MSRWPLCALLILAGLAAAPPAAALVTPGWSQTTVGVNGRTIQEIRFGGIRENEELVILVLTNGPANGTTSLFATAFNASVLVNGPLLTFAALRQQGSIFSVGGGCEAPGGATVFTGIENFRPIMITHTAAAGFQIDPFTIPGNDQYVGAECVSSNDRSRVTFALQNHTQHRIDLATRDASGVRLENAGFGNVKSTFEGGARVALGRGIGLNASVSYMRIDGTVPLVSFDTSTLALQSNCPATVVNPSPSAFTAPLDLRVPASLTITGGVRTGLFGDPQLDGVNDYTTFNPAGGCSATTLSAGASSGAPPYNWVGIFALAKLDFILFGNGAAFGKIDAETGAKQFLTPPPISAGGPVDAIGVRDGDSGRWGVLVAGVSPSSPSSLVFAYQPGPIAPAAPALLRSSFEDRGPAVVVSGNQ